MNFNNLEKSDVEIYDLIRKEKERQNNTIEMIASENFTSLSVMEAMGSYFTNKYAEGYPSKRYYGGCHVIDEVESLAIERAKELFNAEHANVQAHSGSSANMAVFFSVLKPGDVILSMRLDSGGHLTHGSKVNFSGKLYDVKFYDLDKNGYIDYEDIERKSKEYKPKLILAGASAYPRIIDFERISKIAKEVGAYFMVDMAHIAGLVATNLHPSPVPYADFVTSTTHKTLRGPRGGLILCKSEYKDLIDKSIFPGMQGGPLEHIIAAKAVCFKEAMQDSFKEYTKKVLENTKTLALELINYEFNLSTNGTDNHLILIDLTNKNITGKEAEVLLDDTGIAVNKNMIPNDTKSPQVTSGIRLGTAAITTRGFEKEDIIEVASIINDVITNKEVEKNKIRVRKLCDKYPLYSGEYES